MNSAASIIEHARAIIAAVATPDAGDDDLYLCPAEAMAWLPMPDASEGERRRRFQRLRDGTPNLRRRTIRGTTCVHIADWRGVIRIEGRREEAPDPTPAQIAADKLAIRARSISQSFRSPRHKHADFLGNNDAFD
jgi:hypothetical protein